MLECNSILLLIDEATKICNFIYIILPCEWCNITVEWVMSKIEKNNKMSHVNKLKKILQRDQGEFAEGLSADSEEEVGTHSAAEVELVSEVGPLKKTNEDLEIKVAELKHSLLVALADKENLKKAMLKDIDSVREYAITKFAEQIVSSLDYLEKTRDSLDGNDADSTESIKNILAGVNMTAKHINDVLKENGVNKIMPLGQKFDHNYHQAIQSIEGQEQEMGLVKEVLQCGYTINNRVLRPAVVVVFR